MSQYTSKRRERVTRRQAKAAEEAMRMQQERDRRNRETAEEIEVSYMATLDALVARDLPVDGEDELDLQRFNKFQAEATLKSLQELEKGTVLVPQSQIRERPDNSQELQQLRTEAARLNAELNTAKQRAAESERDFLQLQGQIQTATDDAQALHAQVTQLTQDRDDLRTRLAVTESERDRARADFEMCRTELQTTTQNLTGEVSRSAGLEQELQALRAQQVPPPAGRAPAIQAAQAVGGGIKRAVGKARENLSQSGSGPTHR
ncbi:MAG: hypothetical protein WDN27_04465 [Candidatus Saccharibacteria bacterium]